MVFTLNSFDFEWRNSVRRTSDGGGQQAPEIASRRRPPPFAAPK
jgi:hypothetical protein